MRRALLATVAVLAFGASSAPAAERTYRIGPIQLGGYQTAYKASLSLPHPKDPKVALTYMHARLVDRQGRLVPQETVMLHHAAFVNWGRFNGDKSQDYCGEGDRERFYGTGEEDQSLILPRGYGYRVRAGDRWHASWMVMNHQRRARTVFIEYTIRYQRGWKSTTPVTPHWIGVQPCKRDPIFNVPGGGAPGSEFVKAIDWTPPEDGRIVAVGTHVHGGAKVMRISEPACGGRTVVESFPEYGLADDPIYDVLPQIHEPSPRAASYPLTATGIPVVGGRTYRVRAVYDNELPHARVMGIMHAYVAPAKASVANQKCAPLPDDVETLHYPKPYRTEIPRVFIPLAELGPDGRARPVDELPGNWFRPGGDTEVVLRDLKVNHRKVELPAGSTITYRFEDSFKHDVTTANGPTAVGSQPLDDGARWKLRLTRPGLYNLYCTLHPLDMQQQIRVLPRS